MQIAVQTTHGPFTSESASLRTLPHPQGEIHILDQLFTPEFVKSLWANLAALPYIANDYDNEETRHILHLKCELPAQELLSGGASGLALNSPKLSAVAAVVFAALKRLYPDYQEIAVRRIHVNCIPYGDILSNHVDGEAQSSLTGIYFANAQWLQEWGGELIICDAQGESLYAIEARPGRVALFPGDILHRAGAPNRLCHAHRLTIGHKFRARKA